MRTFEVTFRDGTKRNILALSFADAEFKAGDPWRIVRICEVGFEKLFV